MEGHLFNVGIPYKAIDPKDYNVTSLGLGVGSVIQFTTIKNECRNKKLVALFAVCLYAKPFTNHFQESP